MKLNIILCIVLFLVSCSGKPGTSDDGYAQSSVSASEKHTPHADLPDLPLVYQDGRAGSLRELSGKIALILFQPDCDHCQREAIDIRNNLAGFKDFRLYFVSSATLEEVLGFAREYQLSGRDNISFATTTVSDILKHFGPIDAPSIYLYSEEGQLIQSFNGEVAVEVVLKYI